MHISTQVSLGAYATKFNLMEIIDVYLKNQECAWILTWISSSSELIMEVSLYFVFLVPYFNENK